MIRKALLTNRVFETIAEVLADDTKAAIVFKGKLYLYNQHTDRTYLEVAVHDESALQICWEKNNKMNEQTKDTGKLPVKEIEQNFSSKYTFLFLLITSQLKGFANAFKRKDAKVSAWLYWAAVAIDAAFNDSVMPTEPSGIDDFDSVLSDSWRDRFGIIGWQMNSLGNALGMLDTNNTGKDDKIARTLTRISNVLIRLGE